MVKSSPLKRCTLFFIFYTFIALVKSVPVDTKDIPVNSTLTNSDGNGSTTTQAGMMGSIVPHPNLVVRKNDTLHGKEDEKSKEGLIDGKLPSGNNNTITTVTTNSSAPTPSSTASTPLPGILPESNATEAAKNASTPANGTPPILAPAETAKDLPKEPVKAVVENKEPSKKPNSVAENTTDQSRFPTYDEFRGESHEGSVLPFLAETDTFFSSDSQREYGPSPYEVRYRALGDLEGTFDVIKHWGVLAPYFSSPIFKELQVFRSIPNKCTVKQVHMLHRHGARMPKHDKHESAPMFENWFKNVTSDDPKKNQGKKAIFSGPLEFLTNWQYALGSDNLAPAGYQQMYDSGVFMNYRYSPLFKSKDSNFKTVLRTTSQQRMVDSAKMWSLGFLGFNSSSESDLEIQIEHQGFNSTLAAHESCPGAKLDLEGSHLKEQWIKTYLQRAVERLQHHVKNAKLTPEVVFDMQSLCPYETFALGLSEFCNLFTRNEWQGFEYSHDLVFQGDFGFMSKTGKAQGIGWSQELIARMKGSKISTPLTSQNTTWLENDGVFPLNQTFYADFTHGREIISILTALNFNIFASQLDPYKPDPMRNFIVSHIVPSAARLVFEVLQCDESAQPSSGDAQRHYVRVFLNDALLPMSHEQGCTGHDGVRDGLCPLDNFIQHFDSVSYPAADFVNACFNNEAVRAAKDSAKSQPKSSSSTITPTPANQEDPSDDDDATLFSPSSIESSSKKHSKKQENENQLHQAAFKLA